MNKGLIGRFILTALLLMPFTAFAQDEGQIYKVVDEDGNVTTAADNEAAYRTRIDDEAAAGIRSERDQKLTACDWTILPDSPLSDDAKTEWQTYRQALRDMPADSGFPHSVTWPTEPS